MAQRKTYITVLNVFSCLAVLFMHTSGFWNFRKNVGWIADNAIECVFYFAVPVFVMLSGVTLIDYRDRCTTKEYFIKRIKKTVIPFLTWSILGLLFVICFDGIDSVSLKPLDIINGIITCKYMPLYYFFLIIFGIYLVIPILGSVEKEKRKNIFLYCIVAGITVNIFLPFVSQITDGAILHNGTFTFAACTGYLPYAMIGYYLDNYTPNKKIRIAIYILGAVGFAVHFFGTIYLSYRDGNINSLFKGYNTIWCYMYSSAVFLIFRKIPFDRLPAKLLKTITFFGGQTFGIYLVHIPLMKTIKRLLDISSLDFIQRTIFAIILFILSGLLIKALQKIPIIKHIVP